MKKIEHVLFYDNEAERALKCFRILLGFISQGIGLSSTFQVFNFISGFILHGIRALAQIWLYIDNGCNVHQLMGVISCASTETQTSNPGSHTNKTFIVPYCADVP